MKIFIATDVRVYSNNGKLFIASQVYSILKRYYENYGKIVLCARKVDSIPLKNMYDISEMIEILLPISNFLAPFKGGYRKEILNAIKLCDIVIGRLPSFSGFLCAKYAKKLNKPFFAEVVGDPWDAYWNHSIAGKIIAPYMFFKTKSVVKNADYALYVTNEFLQKRYPCKNESIGVSNVLIKDINEDILQNRIRKIESMKKDEIVLMTTAAVNVRYKGQQYVIKAIPALNKAGVKVKYRLIGGGDTNYLQKVAQKYGVEDQVEFLGRKSLPEVFSLLDAADIYIQPSLQEGLPRSVVEAMSRACPCIGAKTAGIPELISPECVVKRKSSKDIAEKILVLANKEELTRLAKLNFKKSKEYLDSVLTEKRNAYYQKIKEEIVTHAE